MKIKLLKAIIMLTKRFLQIFIVQTLFYSFAIANVASTQNLSMKEMYVKLGVHKTEVIGLFKEIENRSDLKFNYEERDIDKEVHFTFKDGTYSIYQILEKVSRKTGLGFRRINNVIDVTRIQKEPAKVFIEEMFLNKTISGKVTDESGLALPGVNVLVKNTTVGTITNSEGEYTLSVPDDATTLVFSYVGYLSEEVEIGQKTIVNISLAPDISTLSEIVVVGYGTQARKDVTGSIASISAEKIDQRPVASVEDALQGLAPGLNISTRNASPGQLSQVTIRSIGSLSAGYEPLWVVDGFPTDQRNAQSINPADIESVEILKDASSTAIYGSRGANGVIIITTKKGSEGVSSINVAVSTGFSTIPESARTEVLNAAEYIQYHTEANGGTTPDWITNNWDGQTDTDWQDLLYETGVFQDYSVSASGGSNKVSYLLSGNYIDQSGVIPGEDFDKYSARLKVDYRPNDRITIGLNLAPNYSIITASSTNGDFASAHGQALMLPPIIPVNNPDGSFAFGTHVPGNINIGNPLETVQSYKRTTNLFRLLGGLNLAIEVIDGLTLRSTLSTNVGTDNEETIYNAPSIGGPRNGYSAVTTLDLVKREQIGWLNENTINYKLEIAQNHNFDLLGGFTLQKETSEFLRSGVDDLQIVGPTILSIGDSETLTTSNGLSENTLVSFLGRLNYSFMDRYLLTATVRNDGSSRFGANNRYKTFGSFALGWRLSEEAFIQNLGFVDDAKLRVSYGSTGSNAIPDFIARSSLSPENHSFGETQVTGVRISSPGNANLTWETSTQLDIGLDLSLMNGRFNLIFDYYNNETTSLLLSRNVVPSSGFTGFLTNIGSMRNKGVELSLNATVIKKEDFEWSVGGNVTNNDQEILDLGGDDEIRNFFGALRRTVGGELQTIHVTKQIGILRDGDTAPAQPGAQPGDMIYEDVDGDGAISNFLGPDGQLLDGTNLDWVYGINTRVRYKNFELSALLHGQAGASMLDLGLIQIYAPFRRVNLPKEFWFDGRYISESQPGNGVIPRAGSFNTDGIGSVSSIGIQRTDFVRLKNITLTYNVPGTFLERIGISNAFIYTSIENVHTWTDFVGGNPDARRQSGGGPSLFGGSRISGVDDGLENGLSSPPSLPLPRTWTFGVNFSF